MTHRKYKTYTLILLIVTVMALITTAIALTFRQKAQAARDLPVNAPENPNIAYYTPNPPASQENTETDSSDLESGYLVTIYKGGIGVFQEGRTLPVLTSHAEVYLLPEEDIKLLRKGIWARDLSQAKQILEDYD